MPMGSALCKQHVQLYNLLMVHPRRMECSQFNYTLLAEDYFNEQTKIDGYL